MAPCATACEVAVEVPYVHAVQKFVDVPVPRQVEQSVEVPRIEVVDVIVQVPVERRAQRTVEVPQIRKAQRVGDVVRHREDLRLARGGARQPLDVRFPVASRRAGGGPRRGSWRRVR